MSHHSAIPRTAHHPENILPIPFRHIFKLSSLRRISQSSYDYLEIRRILLHDIQTPSHGLINYLCSTRSRSTRCAYSIKAYSIKVIIVVY